VYAVHPFGQGKKSRLQVKQTSLFVEKPAQKAGFLLDTPSPRLETGGSSRTFQQPVNTKAPVDNHSPADTALFPPILLR
jgi:hypothetical protein